MPEWVDNRLTVKGPAQSVQRFTERAQGIDPVYQEGQGKLQVFSFHALCPIPLNVLDESYPQYGFDWELGHWGCKWGARESRLEKASPEKVVYTFDTPTGPPVVLLSNLAQEYDDLSFHLTYNANEFTGLVRFRQGVVVRSRHRAKKQPTYDELSVSL